MKYVKIDQSDKKLSSIGLGTMIFHPDSKDRDFKILDAFIDNGGTFLDTAEVYGSVEEHGYSEMVIGDWLERNQGIRDKLFIMGKGLIPGYCAPIHPGGAKINPESIHKAIDGTLNRMKTDYLDLWMFHRDDISHDVGPLIDALNKEIDDGRIRAFGGSNWTIKRIQECNDYASSNSKIGMCGSSPQFSLAKAKEPYWPDTVVTDNNDKKWFEENNFLLVAWSSLGRGFFSKGDKNFTEDQDLVRVFYSEENFERKKRAIELADKKNVSMYEIAVAYAINQKFPVVALTGAATPEEVTINTKAGSLILSDEEINWLDLTTN